MLNDLGITGIQKKSTTAKKTEVVSYALPDVKFEPSDSFSAFMDIGLVLFAQNIDEYKKSGILDMDSLWSKADLPKITNSLAGLYFPIPKDAEGVPIKDAKQLKEIATNRAEFVEAWLPEMNKWKDQFKTPFQSKKAVLVQLELKKLDFMEHKSRARDALAIDDAKLDELLAKNMAQGLTEYSALDWLVRNNKIEEKVLLPPYLQINSCKAQAEKTTFQTWFTRIIYDKDGNAIEDRISGFFEGSNLTELNKTLTIRLTGFETESIPAILVIDGITEKENTKDKTKPYHNITNNKGYDVWV